MKTLPSMYIPAPSLLKWQLPESVPWNQFRYAGLSQKRERAPVEVVFPEEVPGWDLEANALMAKDEINPAAYTFLDWAISDDAMDLYRENYPIVR